jgi:hypothetical protein
MKVKNVWKATWFSILMGLFLAVLFVFLIELFSKENDVFEEVCIAAAILGILGFIYFLIQMTFSLVMSWLFANRTITPNRLLSLSFNTLLFLYAFVFLISWSLNRFSTRKEDFEFIFGFSIPYVVNCLIFVFRLHYLCWKDSEVLNSVKDLK